MCSVMSEFVDVDSFDCGYMRINYYMRRRDHGGRFPRMDSSWILLTTYLQGVFFGL